MLPFDDSVLYILVFPLRVFNYLFVGRLDGLLYEVDKIGWAEFAEC